MTFTHTPPGDDSRHKESALNSLQAGEGASTVEPMMASAENISTADPKMVISSQVHTYMTIGDAAHALRCSTRTIDHWIAAGMLESYRAGRRRMVAVPTCPDGSTAWRTVSEWTRENAPELTDQTVYRMVTRGRIPGARMFGSRVLRIPAAAVMDRE